MREFERRSVLGLALAVAALPGSALAQAGAQSRSVRLDRVFGHLREYYRTPAAQRSHFRPVYVLTTERPLNLGPGFTISHRGATRPLTLNGAGRVLALPTLEELAGGELIIPLAFGQISAGLTVEPVLPLAAALPAGEPQRAIAQANAAIARQAGLLAFTVPRIRGVLFSAPGAMSGVVVTTQGTRRPLPVSANGQALGYRPDDQPNAARLEFSTAPDGAVFE